MGEAAFLSKHHDDIQRSFYKAIPGKNLLQVTPNFQSYFWPLMCNCVTFFFPCRSCVLASVHSGHFGGCYRKSSSNFCYLFHHKPMLCIKLFSLGEDCSYFKQNIWADIHPRNQLDINVPLFSCHNWPKGYQQDRTCIWYTSFPH